MPRLDWGAIGERYYETGVDHGVLYANESTGVAWNGLISVTESPSGGEPKPYYLDGLKFLNIASAEEYTATIQAFSSPSEFDVCDGITSINNGLSITHQLRKSFGLSYRTKLGNDVDGVDHGYKLHFIYNALAAPSEHANETIGDSVDPIDLSWEITTTPPLVTLSSITSGLHEKQSVRVAAIGSAYTYGSSQITGAPLVVDDITLITGDRVIYQVNTALGNIENGVYDVTTPGTGSNGVWTRSADFIDGTLNYLGFVFVDEGTFYKSTRWVLTNPNPITVGNTIKFVKLLIMYKPTAHLVIDSRMVDSVLLTRIEDILYGSSLLFSRLPDPTELIVLFNA